jgi:hypothetical protein
MAVIMTPEAVRQMREAEAVRKGEEIARQAMKASEQEEAAAAAEPPPGFDVLLEPKEPLTLTIHGEAVKLVIKPMNVGRLIEFSQVADPFLDQLIDYFKKGEVMLGTLMSVHGDRFLQSIAIAAGLTREQVDSLEFGECMTLAGKVILVNLDFFRRRLREIAALLTAAVQHAGANKLAGSTFASPSPSTAGAGAKSSA